eukprot:gene22438-27076_t
MVAGRECSRTTCTLPLTSRSVNTRDITTVDISSQSTCTPVGAAAASVLSVSSCQATAGASHTRGASVTVQSSVTSVEYGSFSALIPLVVWYPQANTGGRALAGWRITVSYNAELVEYRSLTQFDQLWSTATVNADEGQVTIVVSSISSQASPADLKGDEVDIVRVNVRARNVAGAGLQPAPGNTSIFTDVFQLEVLDMNDDANSEFVNDEDGLVVDMRDGGTASGSLGLRSMAVAGVYGYPRTPTDLANSAPLTSSGTCVPGAGGQWELQAHAHRALAEATAHVELLQELLKEADSASVVVYATFSDGTVADVTDEPDIEVTSLYPDSLNITQEPWGVYAVSVTPEDFTLDRIDGLPNVTGLDVTPLVTFTTSQPGVARVDEAALQGVAAGSTSVGLQASFAALQPATVQVVNGTVRVTMLEAVAVSGVDFGDWTPDNSPSIDPAE